MAMSRSATQQSRWQGAVVLAAVVVMGACDDDKSSAKPSTAQCSAASLESDLDADELTGPGVDTNTGQLLFEPGSRYVVSSTYIVPKPGPDGAPVTAQYQQLFPALLAQLQDEPGLLAVQLASSDSCKSGRTLAVWKSEEDMYHFVTSSAHTKAMAAIHEVAEPGYEVTHWTATTIEQTQWSEAVRRLAGTP